MSQRERWFALNVLRLTGETYLQSDHTSDYTLVQAARIFDGTGSAPESGKAVLLHGGHVAAIGSESELRAPDGSSVAVKNYGEATILPGLVDGHTHMMAPGDGTPGDVTGAEQDDILLMRALQNARTFLHAGVTTARENGAKNKVGFSLKDGINKGLTEGPEMVISGRPITITGGHFRYCGSEADGIDGVRAEEIKKALQADIQEELNHAQTLARRIKTIGGRVPGSSEFKPEQASLQPRPDSTDVVSVIKGVIEAEDSAIAQYNKLIRLCDGVDYVTQDLCIQSLADEEEHRRDFLGYLAEYEQAS